MANELVQIDYLSTDTVRQRFQKLASRIQDLEQLLQRGMQPLRDGGWQGESAQRCFNELDSIVFPAIRRLQTVFQEASDLTRQIQIVFRYSEEEAAALFKGTVEAVAAKPRAFQNVQVAAHVEEQTYNPEPLRQRLRDWLVERQQPVVQAGGVAGVLPIAGGLALADGPLPIGDLIALGLLGVAVIGGAALISQNATPATPSHNASVDAEKIGNVIGETEKATGNITSGETLTEDEALDAIGQWIGDAEEVSPGVFRSKTPNADGTYNQGRIDDGSLAGDHSPDVPHVHLERVKPDPRRPGRWEYVSNNHIPIVP
ncbi:WXG100 family type VII secretion target [Herpetosiphon sp. NSE202]|uniref:WXG100 family type VII secretion target n=1 Tax=Herpetosiphon sp. NSE202 TaxID=3351349 RepID=UPI00362BDA02